ncbi:MAG: sulfite exporter TauE/SafE family protein [Candidatus Thermoplasmatota archaeon]|nr:sulfite exporter TauE/SafE family protein [Candidatus Thermoplasmatota archaeon]
MDVLIVFIITLGAFIAAALTVPAGFGLSTMLTPLVLFIVSPHEAVAIVAIIHGAHNGWKLIVLKEHVDFEAFKRYGIWLVIGAVGGALLQSQVPPDPLLLIIGIFLVILPILTISEGWTGYRIPEANDRIGGFGSGFMGGLSGHQGALRAMFLKRRLSDKMSYAATASVLALCVDLTRSPVYIIFNETEIIENFSLLLPLTISALLGVQVGKSFLERLKSDTIHFAIMIGIVCSGLYYIFEAL